MALSALEKNMKAERFFLGALGSFFLRSFLAGFSAFALGSFLGFSALGFLAGFSALGSLALGAALFFLGFCRRIDLDESTLQHIQVQGL